MRILNSVTWNSPYSPYISPHLYPFPLPPLLNHLFLPHLPLSPFAHQNSSSLISMVLLKEIQVWQTMEEYLGMLMGKSLEYIMVSWAQARIVQMELRVLIQGLQIA